ncbi:MAG TPA: RNA-binding protein, partial [Spirochaetota bacterium]|nr:RNA-binding protein [Spirochaetota bacterium]
MNQQKLFVGNVNYSATVEDLRALFGQYGTVLSVKMRPRKGCAFVEMSSNEEAETAVRNLNEKVFFERELRVSHELSTKKAKALTIR